MNRRKFISLSGLVLGGVFSGSLFMPSLGVKRLLGRINFLDWRMRPGEVIEVEYTFDSKVCKDGHFFWFYRVDDVDRCVGSQSVKFSGFHGVIGVEVPLVRSGGESVLLSGVVECEEGYLSYKGEGLEVICGMYRYGM